MRVVIDTNVLFEGLTKRSGSCYTIVQGWDQGLFEVMVSHPLLLEYQDVLARKLSPKRWELVRPVLARLLSKVTEAHVYYRWRPTSPDPSDDFVIDCAMNSNARLITYNMKDFRSAQKSLGLRVMTPTEFVHLLKRNQA